MVWDLYKWEGDLAWGLFKGVVCISLVGLGSIFILWYGVYIWGFGLKIYFRGLYLFRSIFSMYALYSFLGCREGVICTIVDYNSVNWQRVLYKWARHMAKNIARFI